MKYIDRQLVKFLAIGVLTFFLDYGLTISLHYWGGLEGYIASSIGFTCAFLFNFFMSRQWVFHSKDPRRFSSKVQMTLFLILTFLNLGVSTIFVAVSSQFGVEVAVSKVVITAFIAAWNYIINKKVIFS